MFGWIAGNGELNPPTEPTMEERVARLEDRSKAIFDITGEIESYNHVFQEQIARLEEKNEKYARTLHYYTITMAIVAISLIVTGILCLALA